MTTPDDDWHVLATDRPPLYEDLLLAAKPPTHLKWKYGVGSFVEWRGEPMEIDWGWAFPPTHWRRIIPPKST